MARRDRSALDETIRIGAMLKFIQENARPISLREIAQNISDTAHGAGIWLGARRSTGSSVYNDIGKITGGSKILGEDKAAEWSTVITSFFSSPIIARIPAFNGIGDTSDIRSEELDRYRVSIERNLGLNQYIRIPQRISITNRRSAVLSGVWRMFRVSSSNEVLGNLMFFRVNKITEKDAFKFERLLVTDERAAWSSEGFLGESSDLITFTSSRAGTSAFSVMRVISIDPLVVVGVRVGQGPDRGEKEQLLIRGELIFGFRIHKANIGTPTADKEIRDALQGCCDPAAKNPADSVSAVIRAITNPDVVRADDSRLILDGFRRTQGGDSDGKFDILKYVRNFDGRVADVLARITLNDVPFGLDPCSFLKIDANYVERFAIDQV